MRAIRADKLAIVFRRELWTTVTRPGFIISTLALPLLPLFLILLTTFTDPERILSGDRRASVALVDESDQLDLTILEGEPEWLPGEDRYLRFADRESAVEALLGGEVTGVVIVPADFLSTGRLEAVRMREGLAGGFVRPFGGRLPLVLRLCLLHGRVPEEIFDRLVAGVELDERVLDQDGLEVSEETIDEDIRRFLVPVIAAVFLAFAIFAGAGYLLLGMSDEKENRVMELLLASLTPEELLAGKLLGIGTAGIIQFALWVLVVAVPAVVLLPGLGLRADLILWTTGFFLAGYLFFGAMMLGIGAVADTTRHAQQISAVFSMLAMLPFLFNFLILQSPDGLLSRTLSVIPFTSPMTMMLRMAIEPPSTVEMSIVLTVLVASGILALLGASRLFRATGLLYGKRPTPSEIWRWLIKAC